MMGEDIEFDSVQEFIDGAKSGRKPFEKTFHRKPNLSFGVQVFKPNADYTHKGNQPVHEFDELYYIVEAGKDEEAGKLQVDGKDYCVKPGSLYFIPKKVPHKFYDNKKDIVFFYIFGGEDEVFYPHIEELFKEFVRRIRPLKMDKRQDFLDEALKDVAGGTEKAVKGLDRLKEKMGLGS